MAEERKYGKYTELFCEIQPEQGRDEPYYAQPFAYFKGDKDVPGAKYRNVVFPCDVSCHGFILSCRFLFVLW